MRWLRSYALFLGVLCGNRIKFVQWDWVECVQAAVK